MEKKKFDFTSPVLVELNDMAEVVYADIAGSGYTPENPGPGGDVVASDCYVIGCKNVQDWNGSHTVFEVHAKHSASVNHITTDLKIDLLFSNVLGTKKIVNAYSEFPSTFTTDTVSIRRERLADGYKSGDDITFKVWVQLDSEQGNGKPCPKPDRIAYSCNHAVNVQGNVD